MVKHLLDQFSETLRGCAFIQKMHLKLLAKLSFGKSSLRLRKVRPVVRII